MTDFLSNDKPNFMFNGINALIDMGCIIEKELPDVTAQPNIEEISVLGRSGSLLEWYGDYKPYDLEVGMISIPYENLEDIKRWLSGSGKLITHNDVDKYIDATPSFSSSMSFENEWGVFYNFSLTFHCQPIKYKVNEQYIYLSSNSTVFNPGSEKSGPFLEIETENDEGSLSITCNGVTLEIPNVNSGVITIDCEKALIVQSDKQLSSKGEWPEILPGENEIKIDGNFSTAKILLRSSWI